MCASLNHKSKRQCINHVKVLLIFNDWVLLTTLTEKKATLFRYTAYVPKLPQETVQNRGRVLSPNAIKPAPLLIEIPYLSHTKIFAHALHYETPLTLQSARNYDQFMGPGRR